MRVGVLSTVNEPTLPLIMASLYMNGVRDLAVILDEKIASQKDQAIWRERTAGVFENTPDASLHGFEADAPPFYFVRNHNGNACLELIGRLGLACLVNAGTPRRLSNEILHSVPHGAINVHPGILPHYRGCSCVEWAIYNDDAIGNTAHFMTEGYDEGPIIKLESYEFPRDADYQSIRIKTYRNGFMLMGKAVALVLGQNLTPAGGMAQETGTYWPPIPPNKMADVQRKIKAHKYRYARL